MFKRLYGAGQRFAGTTLTKFAPGGGTPEERAETAGVIGVGVGNFFESVGYIGMGMTLLAATCVAAAPAGLSVLGFIGFGLLGTGFAGVGTFGKGVKDAGEKASGIIQLTKNFRRAALKAVAQDVRSKLPAIFRRDASPAAESFAEAVAREAATTASRVTAAPKAIAPENK